MSGPVGRVWFLPQVEGRTWPEVTAWAQAAAGCLLSQAPGGSWEWGLCAELGPALALLA